MVHRKVPEHPRSVRVARKFAPPVHVALSAGNTIATTHGLFFALRPDAQAAAAAFDLARRLQKNRGLKGKATSLERLHVTLFWLGEYQRLPPELVARATKAGTDVRVPPFEIAFDHVEVFARPAGPGPLVLTTPRKLAALHELRRLLGSAIRAAGIDVAKHRFRPHLTLNYADCDLARQPVTPIGWRVSEFVLIHSLRGQGIHLELARWPLQSRQMAFDLG